MPRQGPLEWIDGNGWLVLSGSAEHGPGLSEEVDARLLTIANLDRPLVVLLSEGRRSAAEDLLQHYLALGGATGAGFMLPALATDEEQLAELVELLGKAGILYLGGNSPLAMMTQLRQTALLKGMVRGFATLQGLVIVGAGEVGRSLGAWLVASEGQLVTGLNFVRSAVLAPCFTTSQEATKLQQVLAAHPEFVGLGIPSGTALALGPRGQVETWGTGAVTAVVKK